jgi:hypothetical protein
MRGHPRGWQRSVDRGTHRPGIELRKTRPGFLRDDQSLLLIRFLEHRIGDERILRLIRKWLKAGVLEGGVVTESEQGSRQGATISPLLANAYLHYVLDLWAQQWRQHHAIGDMFIVRYADDCVLVLS